MRWILIANLMILIAGPASIGLCAQDEGITYEVLFKGLAEEGLTFKWIQERRLRELLTAVSDTVKLRDRKPAAAAVLQGRVKRDIPRFQNVLKANGYFSPDVTWSMDADRVPVQVVFTVETGPLYLFGRVEIKDVDGNETGPENPRDIGITLGDSAEASIMLKSSDRLMQWYRARGYAFPKVEERKVIVDHSNREVRLDFVVDPGPMAAFGEVTVIGAETIDERVLRNKLPWKEGEPFDVGLLEKGRKRLANTLLFGTVQITTADALDEEGRVPVIVRVVERKHRTVGIGGWYKTEDGPGGRVSWEHRNLFGHAEQLTLSGTVSGITSAAEAEFRKPQFLHPDQDLILDVRYADEEPEAYSSRSFQTSGIVTRHLSERMDLGGGIGYKRSRVEQAGEEDVYTFIYFPVIFDWNTSDDLLVPTRGGRLSTLAAPFVGVSGSDVNFLKSRLSYSRFFKLSERPLIVCAGRVTIGSITGAARDAVPPDERYYAGGGGSVRGYEYQTVAPYKDDDPIGGRSLFEVSAELRIRVAKKMDVIPFIDGGNAFEDTIPEFTQDLLWGAGVGVQYMTGIGPIRLDVAAPLDKREGIDESYQIYLSLGHSF